MAQNSLVFEGRLGYHVAMIGPGAETLPNLPV
jgi:hypothetical protein